jgi:hypothetical protein
MFIFENLSKFETDFGKYLGFTVLWVPYWSIRVRKKSQSLKSHASFLQGFSEATALIPLKSHRTLSDSLQASKLLRLESNILSLILNMPSQPGI